jgi:hypothetical protein
VRQRARGVDTSLSKKALQDTEKDHAALAAAAEDPYAGQYYLVEDTERLAAGQSRLGAKPPVLFPSLALSSTGTAGGGVVE